MLHQENSSLILQNPNELSNLYRMDLEVGKVVDEWKAPGSISFNAFGPQSKLAQTTQEPTLLGLSHHALFVLDPRLSDNKIVESQHQKYASKVQFSAIAMTEAGCIAVASEKGVIRLFDRVGVCAKVTLPSLGEVITGLDISVDGRWILATCKTYLLLIDVLISEGKHKDDLGIKRSLSKESKPRPKGLRLR